MPSTIEPSGHAIDALIGAAGPDALIPASRLREALHPRQIAQQQAAGRLHRLWRGMYWAGTRSDDGRVPVQIRVRAAALTLRRPVAACLDTGAEIYGFGPAVADTHVVADGSSASTRPGLVVHRHRPLAASVTVGDVRVADAAECAARLAARRGASGAPAHELLALLDAALHCGAIESVDTLHNRCLALTGAGVRPLCRVAAVASGSARTADDSWIRWWCFERGLDVPDIDADGSGPSTVPAAARVPWIDGRADFAWPRYRTTAAIVAPETPGRWRGPFEVIPAPGCEWTHVLLARAPYPERMTDGCPIHPTALWHLFAVMSGGRRRFVRPGAPPPDSGPRLLFRPLRAFRK